MAATDFSDLPHLKGDIVRPTDRSYKDHQYQYAFSSHGEDGSMSPGAIIYPKYPNADADVEATIAYARDKGVAIAVRTGGHQYSGASSTCADNLLLDLSAAYKEFEWNNETGVLRAGISYALKDFNAKLGALGLFVPHGQCSHVHVGGHAHTGGYGQLGRAFGLFGDHIVGIEVYTADGKKHILKRGEGSPEDKDLFWAVLGGSPGNFGILTHIHLKPYRDVDHPNARGYKGATLYCKDKLLALLKIKAAMADDPNFPRDLDYCVTVMSSAQVMLPHFHVDLVDMPDEWIKYKHTAELSTGNELPVWPAAIIVYVQWANTGGTAQPFDDFSAKWIHSVRDVIDSKSTILDVLHASVTLVSPDKPTPMSKLTTDWVFMNIREFEMPYEKRTYLTNKTTLVADGWAEWVTDRIDQVEMDPVNGCKVVVQIQHFGGNHSMFRIKDDGTTSYSWRRDTTVCCVLDCFYDSHDLAPKIAHKDAKKEAFDWQAGNDTCVGTKGAIFCETDRRVLWGSYGERDLSKVWAFYHESQAKYDRLLSIKSRVDRTGVFSPNAFCVGGARPHREAAVPHAPMSDAAGRASFLRRMWNALLHSL